MASGLVCRANRPNTWLHRPACKREEKPCQLGAVHTWHKADISGASVDVRFQGQKRTWSNDGAGLIKSDRRGGPFASTALSEHRLFLGL
jgi:hypothetical protein